MSHPWDRSSSNQQILGSDLGNASETHFGATGRLRPLEHESLAIDLLDRFDSALAIRDLAGVVFEVQLREYRSMCSRLMLWCVPSMLRFEFPKKPSTVLVVALRPVPSSSRAYSSSLWFTVSWLANSRPIVCTPETIGI